ncbi:gluconate:H+ symporter [Actinokineospora sp. G85]|uniref:GntT/GntP/DsdX family permease n=1 Tax=Actinokineospora sp. G85 TaxID=3406626 RepID=UPI003C716DBD
MSGADWRLIGSALAAIALIVLLITKLKLHPFLGLILGSGLLGLAAGMPTGKLIESFSDGVGSTVAGVGVLIALGAMLGKLLADSGGADQVVDTIMGRSGARRLPWAMTLVAVIIGLPMFFEIGLVMLIPVVLLAARRARVNVMLLGIPALAGLSVLHGLVPPHPGPLVAVDALKADLGLTLGLGLLVAIPTVIVAGPLFAKVAAGWVQVAPPPEPPARERTTDHRPSFTATLATVLLPVVLMMGKALADIVLAEGNPVRGALDFVGDPLVALLAAVLVGMVTLGRGAGLTRDRIGETLSSSLPPIAGILLIVGAGGGFKQTLVDAGVGETVTRLAEGAALSPIILGWLIAVAIRLATGSATVATISAAGIIGDLALGLPPAQAALLALAIGAGSVFFSHVNDAGFWLVKEYFGFTVGQTIRTWSVMETLISVVAIAIIYPLSLIL